MRNASALSRLVAPMIAVGILVGGCGQTPAPRTAGTAGTADAGATGLYGETAPGHPPGLPASRWPPARTATGKLPQATPGQPAGGHRLPESRQWPQRGGRGGHRPDSRADRRFPVRTRLFLAPDGTGQPGLQSPLLRPRRHRLRRVQRQDRQLHRRPAARRLAAPLRFAAPRGHRRRRERRLPRRNRPADLSQRRASDRQRPAALPRGPAGHGRDPRPRRRTTAAGGAPRWTRCWARWRPGTRFPLWASGTG